MANRKMTLCAACTACPEVEIIAQADEVRIGETDNLVTLKKDAWNTLVDLIKSGQLTRI